MKIPMLVLASAVGLGVSAQQPSASTTRPVVTLQVAPEYTEPARRKLIRGNVLLEVHVNARGTVDSAVLLRGLGYGLDDKAIDAVMQYKFRPAMMEGVPVSSVIQLEVSFSLL